MSVIYNKFNSTVAFLANGGFNLGSDTLKIALTDSSPIATNTVIGNISQISYSNIQNGGTTGLNVTVTSSTQSSGLYKLLVSQPTLTATGSVPQFRYVVLYDSTSGDLIAWYDNGSEVNMGTNDTFTVNFDLTNGVFQLQ